MRGRFHAPFATRLDSKIRYGAPVKPVVGCGVIKTALLLNWAQPFINFHDRFMFEDFHPFPTPEEVNS